MIPTYDPFNREDDWPPIRVALEGEMIERDGKYYLKFHIAEGHTPFLVIEICVVVARMIYQRSVQFIIDADCRRLPEAFFSKEEAIEICKQFEAQ